MLLPCNVIVYETGPDRSAVAAIAPKVMVKVAPGNAALEAVASDADAKLRAALQVLTG